jgi:hypothetical protein
MNKLPLKIIKKAVRLKNSGWTARKIASISGITENAVYHRLHLGRSLGMSVHINVQHSEWGTKGNIIKNLMKKKIMSHEM